MTIIYPDRRSYYDGGDPYRFGCPDEENCNPEECELLEQETIELQVVAAHLWPKAARTAADKHNDECHNGAPTAHIDAEASGPQKLPRYKVWCPKCGKGTVCQESQARER